MLWYLIKANAKYPTGSPRQQDLKEFHGYISKEHNLRETLIMRCLRKQDTIILNQQEELIANSPANISDSKIIAPECLPFRKRKLNMLKQGVVGSYE